MRATKFIVPILLILGSAWTAPAEAHAFGQRYDLPLPLWMFVGSGAAAVLLSFVVIAVFLQQKSEPGDYPTYNLLGNPFGRFLAHPAFLHLVRGVFFFIFLLTVASGYVGDPSPYKNISVVMFWVIAWVGLAFVCSLLGNFYALINPWNAAFAWAEALWRRNRPERALSLNLPYPEGLGAWPAFIFFFAFAWMEITWPGSGIPLNIAIILTVYSIFTWLGMFLYGREVWLENGEAFSVVYALFARFAITEVRVLGANGHINNYGAYLAAPPERRAWNLRPPGVGLRVDKVPSTTLMFFVLLLLSTVTYDGYTETEHFQRMGLLLFQQISELGQAAIGIVETVGISSFPLMFIIVYLGFMALVGLAAGNLKDFGLIAPLFVLSIVPISIAYHLSHYLSLFVFEGQIVIGRLSDPFGAGWDLFGTAGYKTDMTVMSAKFVWFFSMIAIIIGHIVAVYLSHAEALRLYDDHRRALVSQIPMLVLMVGYTMLSLWIVAQPIIG